MCQMNFESPDLVIIAIIVCKRDQKKKVSCCVCWRIYLHCLNFTFFLLLFRKNLHKTKVVCSCYFVSEKNPNGEKRKRCILKINENCILEYLCWFFKRLFKDAN